ncbi:ATP-binding protein [Streptomyces sp. SBT349]|uniref:ATP-binding protein n=1 Tax=Streptomyces sp. SBT349 TaxID=1580539 RepID=UPI002277281B|nr:helix-turn-helix domain-containing protein [Streptomyces sp. SBT349]
MGADTTFGSALRAWRHSRGYSLRRLAGEVHYSVGWLSKLENGAGQPTPAVAQACDRVLDADGELVDLALAGQTPHVGAAVRPVQIPAGAGNFIGRAGELAALDELLGSAASSRSVMTAVIDGPPGVGKTALAIRWAHTVQSRFPGGVLFADLQGFGPGGSPADPADVLMTFLSSLGMPLETIPAGKEQRAAMMRSLAADRPVLIVADNAIDSVQVEPLVPGAAGSAVLVTSRRRLTGLAVRHGTGRLDLGPLSPADAQAMVAAVVGERADQEPEAVRLLTQQCARLPLALRIAADGIAVLPYASVAQAAADLSADASRLEVLTAGEDETLAVREAFSWSYQNLTANEARIFRLTGLHPGPTLSLGAAVALDRRPPAEVRHTLSRLADVHLIEATGPDRWKLHPLLRLYAAQRAAAEDPECPSAIRRLSQWYLREARSAHHTLAPHWHLPVTAAQFREHEPSRDTRQMMQPASFSSRAAALAWLDEEAENLAAVASLAAEHQLPAAWQLPMWLWSWVHQRRHWTAWLHAFETARQHAHTAGEPAAMGWLTGALAHAHLMSDEVDAADSLFRQVAAPQGTRPDVHGLACSTAGRGDIAQQRRDIGTAREHFLRAAAYLPDLDQFGQAAMLARLGQFARITREFDAARRYLERALQAFGAFEDPFVYGHTLTALAVLAREGGDIRRASTLLEEALSARQVAGDLWAHAEILTERGRLALAAGRPEDVTIAWRKAADEFDSLGDPRGVDLRRQLPRAPEYGHG